MEDRGIVSMYFDRDERAVFETDRKYGAHLRRVSVNLTGILEDAEECVNDTYLTAWKRMPPDEPKMLKAYLTRIVRNISVSLFRRRHALKRYRGMEILLSEMGECLPDKTGETESEAAEIRRALNGFVRALPDEDCALFVRRYFYLESVKDLSESTKMRAQTVTQRLYKIRQRLRAHLEKEGISL